MVNKTFCDICEIELRFQTDHWKLTLERGEQQKALEHVQDLCNDCRNAVSTLISTKKPEIRVQILSTRISAAKRRSEAQQGLISTGIDRPRVDYGLD